MRVLPDVFQATSVEGQPTLLVEEGYLTLIDTGDPGDEVKLLDMISSIGRRPSDVAQILITHSDGDHIGCIAALVAATGASVYASAGEAPVIEGSRAPRLPEYRADGPVAVSKVVEGGMVLPIHDGVEVIATPGHTADHVSYRLLRRNLLISGDALNNVEGLEGSMPQWTQDPSRARETVLALASIGPDSICFGHGPPIVGDAGARLTELAASVAEV
jgi:glyoxylase-like metal-dependent hydrolase (beta-lactamase superfamily II)